MRTTAFYSAITVFVSLLAGCANVPSPNYVGLKDDDSGITVDDIVGHIQCELYNADGFGDLAAKKYRASVTLTLKVEDNTGLSPSLSFIRPFAVASTSLTYGVGGTLSVDRQRQFIDQYTIALDLLADPAKRQSVDCGRPGKTTLNLTGDLGIGGIIAAGLDTAKYQSVNVKAPTGSAGGQGSSYNIILDPTKPAGTPPNGLVLPVKPVTSPAPAPVPPAFGSTIQFTIVKSANAGPTWLLKMFKGPSGSNGLFNYGRTDTDTLVLAFAPADTPDLTHGGFYRSAAVVALQNQLDAAAEQRAQSQMQSLTTTMILQNLGTLQTTPP